MEEQNLFMSEFAKIAGCHRNTAINYEKKGLISSSRDINGFRRFSVSEALRLKGLLEVRS